MLDIVWTLARRPVPKDDTGATATEYALLVAFIALAIVLGVTAFGTQLSGFYNGFANRLVGLN